MSKYVLDVTAGGKMMWFNQNDNRAIFLDKRNETLELSDGRVIQIAPDAQADFRNLPFNNNQFRLCVFDPPHLERLGKSSWTYAKYGALFPTWRDDLAAGFEACFRVLKPGGTLIFKWNEYQIPVTEILKLTPRKPLYGYRSGKASKTHWIAFIKEEHPQCPEN